MKLFTFKDFLLPGLPENDWNIYQSQNLSDRCNAKVNEWLSSAPVLRLNKSEFKPGWYESVGEYTHIGKLVCIEEVK